ncbi:MAG: DNA translocase FtsK [Candidatus Nealsonbacteria bacterium]|nr:DNA translocase FtsK [Candidatus Nealsonbacteria bacterium]
MPNKNKKPKKILLKNSKEKRFSLFILPQNIKKWMVVILMFLLALILILSFFNLAGPGGEFLVKNIYFLIGGTIFIFPLFLAIGGLLFFYSKEKKFWGLFLLAILFFIFSISGTLECLRPGYRIGGYIGYFSRPFLKIFGFWVTQLVLTGFFFIAVLIFWYLFFPPLLEKDKLEKGKIEKKQSLINKLVKKIIKQPEPKFKIKEILPLAQPREEVRTGVELKPVELKTKPLIQLKTSEYQAPSLDLLEPETEIPNSGDIGLNSAIIKKTLQNFDIPVEMSEVNIGPTVTQYTLKPAEGIKLSKITTLSNDLALALASHPIRIEAPIPGRSVVGIEIPNKQRAQVKLRNLIENRIFQEGLSNLMIVLGRDVSGNPVYADLAKMPHLLVAGSTGTGKTIFLNSLILSLLFRPPTNFNHFGGQPEILRFILIDPKRVEFPVYNDIPHLLSPVIYNAQKTVNAFSWLVSEMERRFEILSQSKTKNIRGYNEIAFKEEIPVLPYIVVIVDELADLMAAKGREVEAGIIRLAQMSRAVGIHLVVATQRPSVEVITGLIKANITSRITFQVASQVDSRTVLDMAGAEKLLGAGDLLYASAETAKPKRIQASYVSEKEVKKVVNWLKLKSRGDEFKFEEKILENELTKDLGRDLQFSGNEKDDFWENDPLYEEAKKIIIEARKASASLLQRRLRIGYARAARLLDILEKKGLVGPADGAKPREVYFESLDEDKSSFPPIDPQEGDQEGEDGWQKV